MKKLWIAVIAVAITVVAWYLLSPIWRVKLADDASPLQESAASSSPAQESSMVASSESASPASATVIAQGDFVPGAHDVSGKALLIEQSGKHILRFENFETIDGPDLHIYLATGLDMAPFVDLGSIKATKGNVNYMLDDSVDVTTYRTVMVWCKPFGVLFSSASLQ